ncbi:MAG: glycosyltransferase family 2 protein [Acidimicrobiales bacterium]
MSAPEESQEPALGAPPEQVVAPLVTLVMVAHEPGPWFDEALAAVGAQDYPSLEVVVVDAASLVPVADRVAEVLPDARTIRLEANRGFGRAINAVLPRLGDPAFLVLAHDDVAPAPGAIRSMVEEAFRSNAAIVGPKVVRWDDDRRMLSAGEGSDKFGFPVPLVERNELDQEQHDAVRDVFTVPDAFTLVRTDLLRALDGFDADTSFFGDDLDLCWRAHTAGARVMVAPNARVRHLEALGERRIVDDRRRLQFRHRMRAMLSSYRLSTLVVVLPQLAVVHVVEAVFALVTGRPGQARDVITAWTWNLRRLGSLRQRRRSIAATRLVPDREIRSLQVRGSARVAAFLRGQLATDQDTFGSAATVGKRLIESVTGPGRRDAAFAWALVVVILVIGSRHLLTRPIPAIGEFVPFPEHLGPLWSEWFSSWRRGGIGYEGFAPAASLVVTVAGGVFLGATGLLRTVLILGMYPLALLGVWRLVAPLAAHRASVAALVAYAAVPLGYDALATGSWRGLVAYAVAPWVLARLLRSSGTTPFGAADDHPGRRVGPRHDVPPLWRQAVALGLVVALAALLDPLFLLMPFAVVVGMVPGSLLIGTVRGLGRMAVVGVGAALVGGVLHAPWLFDLLSTNPSWSTLTASRSAEAATALPLTHILRFDTGPIGSSLLNAAVLVAAAFAVLVGRQWRLVWAVRAWSLALSCWALVWVASMGWIPGPLPPVDAILAPAAAAMALSAGLGVSAFGFDVRRSGFGWRQLAGVVAVGALVLALLPVVAASVGGRWMVPRGSHHESLAFLDEELEQDPFRVVWFGAPEVLPLGAWPIDGLTSYATTISGTPTLADLWPGPPEPATSPLRGSLDLVLTQRTDRLGRLLAPMGVRYLVVVDQGAPVPFGGVSHTNPQLLHDVLAEQLDLVEIDVNPALTVYRNAAWAPTVSALEAETIAVADVAAIPDGAREAAALDLGDLARPFDQLGRTSFSDRVTEPAQVLVGSTPRSGWRADLDGTTLGSQPGLGWATSFPVEDSGTVSVTWATPLSHRLVLLAQLAVLVLITLVMYRTRAERRIARRHRRAISSPVEEVTSR